MLVWIDPVSLRTVIGTHAPKGVARAAVPDNADPNRVCFNPGNGMAEPAPPRPSQAHVMDARTGTWTDPSNGAAKLAGYEAERTRLLRASDWTQIADSGLVSSLAWRDYRSKLRAMTFSANAEPKWPTPPSS